MDFNRRKLLFPALLMFFVLFAGMMAFHTFADAAPVEEDGFRPPALLLKGELNMTLPQGAAYVEPGWTALCDADDDISHLVLVQGHPNMDQVGEYTITYSVSNQAGLSKTVTRTVNVVPDGATHRLDESDVPLAAGADLFSEGVSPISVTGAFALVAILGLIAFVAASSIRKSKRH